MSVFNFLRNSMKAWNDCPLKDPGDAGTILTRQSGALHLRSAAAETRTLPRPASKGAHLFIDMEADGGDITLTVTGGFNEDGDTTFVFSDPQQFLYLVSTFESLTSTYAWRKIADYSTSNLTPTEAAFLDGVTAGTLTASKALVVGTASQIDAFTVASSAAAQQSVSNGDGTTALAPKSQILGTTKATSSLLIGSFNTTDDTTVAPVLALLKSGNATIGSNTVVASGEVLGEVIFYGADGTDFNSAAAKIACLVDTTPGTGDMPGRLVFSTTTDNTEVLSEAFRIDNAQRIVGGAVAAQTVGGVIGSYQEWGTTQAKSQSVLGCASVTDGTSAELAFVKGGNAAVGSFTTVASGEALGQVTFYGDNGTDYSLPFAGIKAFVDTTPGAADAPGRLAFYTTLDGAATLTERLRITNGGVLTTLVAAPANVTALGAMIPQGGIAITDVLNAWIDDATHGSGTVAHLIGNQTITTSSDSRIKKNIQPYGMACAAIERAPRVVSFEYDHPNWGGDRAAPDDEDARKWGPNARGRYVGFLAQETIDWAPWVVNAGAGKDCPHCREGKPCDDPTHPFWSVEYQHLVPLLVGALKELVGRVKRLESGLSA